MRSVLKGGDEIKDTGEFDPLAPQDGTVIGDDFIVGEIVRPGRMLFEISDESIRWVVAHLQPDDATRVNVGTPAQVSPDSEHGLKGSVVLIHPRLEENTRTRAARIEVRDNANRLHPGQFVRATLQTVAGALVIAAPRLSVVLLRGAATVFKAKDGAFQPQRIRIEQTSDGWSEIRASLARARPSPPRICSSSSRWC
jgi:membrane fusion protein, heavy metal efflux system